MSHGVKCGARRPGRCGEASVLDCFPDPGHSMKVLERPVRLRGVRIGTCCNPRFFGGRGFAEWIEFDDFSDLPSLPDLQRLTLDDGHAAVLVRFEETGFCLRRPRYRISHVELHVVP